MPNLLKQLAEQDIAFYSLVEGTDNKKNPRMAITQSYKRIIRRAKNNGDTRCLLAEDDICFTAPGAWQYFLSHIPESFDLYCGLVYHGTVEGNRIMRGMSGTMTLWCVHQRFYDVILNLPDDIYIDRECGRIAHQYEYFVPPEYVCYQSGSYSDSLKRSLNYDSYMVGKSFFGRGGSILSNGVWVAL